jgi:hypothetical protein
MAKKYTRDNRGRFASTGATARGGRLRTASGNKRKTETMMAAGAGGAGVMKGAVKRDLGAMAKRQGASSQRQTSVKLDAKGVAKPKPSKAEKAINAAKQRLKTKQYGYTASQGNAIVNDRRVAAMTPRQYAASDVRGARAMVQRTRRALKDPINATAPARWRESMQRSLADNVKTFKDAAQDYRRVVPKRRK